MVASFLKKIFRPKQECDARQATGRSWFLNDEAQVTRQKLQSVRAHKTEQTKLPSDSQETTLRAHLLDDDKKRPTYNTSQLAMAYWMYGESTEAANFSGSKANRKRKTLSQGTQSYPGMGLDSACFASFISSSAKHKALTQYYVHTRDQIASSGTYWSAASPVSQHKPVEPSPSKYIECPELGGVQEILYNMVRDPDIAVRKSIAENEHTPIAAMWILLEDESSEVRLKLAQNAKCAVSIMEALINDKDRLVAAKAAKTMRRIWAEAGAGIASGNFEEECEAPELLKDAM